MQRRFLEEMECKKLFWREIKSVIDANTIFRVESIFRLKNEYSTQFCYHNINICATHTSRNPAQDPLKNVEGSGTMMGGISGILWAGSRSEDGEQHTPHHSTGEGGGQGGKSQWKTNHSMNILTHFLFLLY